MAAVRGVMLPNQYCPGGGVLTGCRPPQPAQKMSRSPTVFPQWLQKGILSMYTFVR
jgi:hypothetical protein